MERGDFHEMQEAVWGLQRLTRQILNQTIQIAFHWEYLNRENYKKTGENLDLLNETGYKSLDGYIYNCLKDQCGDMASSNINATIQKAWSRYKQDQKDVRNGDKSIPSYKRDQPLVINTDCIRIKWVDRDPTVDMTLFSKKYKAEHGFYSNVRFSFRLHDGTQRKILDSVLNGTYGLGQCQLAYDRPKWFLLLTYTFPPQKNDLEIGKILGVDLGEANAVYASVFNEYGSLRIDGGQVTHFARAMEARRREMLHQARFCGEGRVGHGTKTRISNVYSAEDKIARFRDTINHRYSKAVVDYAVKNRCGIIQMEDLSGIKEDTGYPKKLQHWTYYDLQKKIKAKAKEHGILVKRIDPRFTSQRCSRCGHIEKANREDQAHFCCKKCGFKANADYNASQNIAIDQIDKIIGKTINANG